MPLEHNFLPNELKSTDMGKDTVGLSSLLAEVGASKAGQVVMVLDCNFGGYDRSGDVAFEVPAPPAAWATPASASAGTAIATVPASASAVPRVPGQPLSPPAGKVGATVRAPPLLAAGAPSA